MSRHKQHPGYGCAPRSPLESGAIRRLKRGALLVYYAYCAHVNASDWRAFPSNQTLAKYTGLSERSISRLRKELADLGVIRIVDPGGGSGRSVVIEIVLNHDTNDVGDSNNKPDTKNGNDPDDNLDNRQQKDRQSKVETMTSSVSTQQKKQNEQLVAAVFDELEIPLSGEKLQMAIQLVANWTSVGRDAVIEVLQTLWKDARNRANTSDTGLFLKMLEEDGHKIVAVVQRRFDSKSAASELRLKLEREEAMRDQRDSMLNEHWNSRSPTIRLRWERLAREKLLRESKIEPIRRTVEAEAKIMCFEHMEEVANGPNLKLADYDEVG